MAKNAQEPSEEAPKPASKPILRCERCGAVYRRLTWSPGKKCPKCKSPDFFPVAIIGGAVDYTLADRRDGYALEDIRFAQLAKWAGMITPNQYTQALSRQRQMRRGKETPHIAQVMAEEGLMDSVQTTAVFEYMCRRRPDEEDETFGQLAMQNKLATPKQIKECMGELKMMAKVRHEVPPLGQYLFEKRYMNEAQVQAVFQMMAKRGEGPVHHIRQFYEANREPTLMEKLMGGPDEPERRRTFFIVCGLAILALIVWGGSLLSGGEKIWYVCTNPDCPRYMQPFLGKREEAYPIKCDVCGQDKVWCARKCLRCGEVFGADGWWGRYQCPKCGSSRTVPYQGK